MEMLQRLRSVDIYNWMIGVLAVLTVSGLYSFYSSGFASTIPGALAQVAATVVIALLVDTMIIRFTEKKWRLSKSAIITGFFVGTIFSPLPDVTIPIIGAVIAIVQKRVIRLNNRPIFNPASFGLVLAGLLFAADHGWWAAAVLPAVIIFGLFIVVVFGRLHLVAPYLLAYWALSGVMILLGLRAGLLENIIVDGTMLFFSFLMLVEPRTSPSVRKGRIVYGVIAGVLAAVLIALNVPYFVPLNLLIANLFTRPLERLLKPRAKASP